MNASGTRKNSSKPAAETVAGPVDWQKVLNETGNLVLLDDASGRGPSYLFRNPVEVLRARTPGDLPGLMQGLDRARNEGLHVAGYMNYEASETDALRETDDGEAASATDAIAWFGVFRERELVDTDRGWPSAGTARGRAFSLREAPGECGREKRSRFIRDLRRIRERLARGDVYQINYTMETVHEFRGDPAALYGLLRRHQPATYCAFIKTDENLILSLSPELFFHAKPAAHGGMLLETRPIKGTIARAIPPGGEKDTALRESLRQDAKTRAENLMITDLLRNDLGRHAKPGSVRVPELFVLESLPGLHQMFSVIRGELAPAKAERLFRDIFPALFPCGSVTGAPKIAARRIIRELEERERGVYTGALGFASPDQAVFNVAIRTLEIQGASTGSLPAGTRARLGSGCGIVWDSKPEAEWRELLLKQSFLTPALDDFRVIETMLLSEGRVYFAREHARRLGRTLRRFHIPRNYRRIRDALEKTARENGKGHFRLRMTIDRAGHYEIAVTALARGFNALGLKTKDKTAEETKGDFRLMLSRERIWSGDPFRRWKTTERRLYDQAFADAKKKGFDDVLFLNENLNVAETCVGNILIYDKKSGWSTPGPGSGALPGTLLAYLENRRPGRIRRRDIKLKELRAARFVFVINSVRGLRRVTKLEPPR